MPYEPFEPWVVEVSGPNRSYVLPHQYFPNYGEANQYSLGFNAAGHENLTASKPFLDIPAATIREKARIRHHVFAIEEERKNGWYHG